MTTILFVEDDPAIRLFCRAALERAQQGSAHRARVIDAADLAAARRLIATEQPDLVVMDVRLPDGNGLELVRELRDAMGERSPLVIIASASVLPAEREAALATGADQFLPKPYRPADLVEAVDSLLWSPRAAPGDP